MGIIGGEEKALRKRPRDKCGVLQINMEIIGSLGSSEEELHIFWGQLFQCCRLIFI